MTSPARTQEAERAEAVYYWALNQLGNAMAVDSLHLWQAEVPATKQAAHNTSWLTKILRLLFGFRSEASDLAIAYYRLNRALRTGYAPTLNGETPGQTTSLEELRQQFEKIVDSIEAQTVNEAGEYSGPSPDRDSLPDEDAEIKLEHLVDFDQMVEDANDRAASEATAGLDQVGINALIAKIDRGVDPDRAFAEAGSAQAAAAQRIAMNAARGLVYDLADTDERVIGWVRYSPTGHPCAFCALLISRQVFYKSRETAVAKAVNGRRDVNEETGVSEKPNQFHDNCRCVAVPVFSIDDFDNSDLYALNRELDQLWQDEIKGKYSGRDALNAWRTLLRRRKQLNTNPLTAQAA